MPNLMTIGQSGDSLIFKLAAIRHVRLLKFDFNDQ